jgi:arylsulfatase A-like enzyme
MDRRDFLRTSGAALASMTLAARPTRSAPGLPNILVILADDLGFADLGCFGGADLRTPNVDRLATEGIVLEQFHANCAVCSPTRAALLTGCYPACVGVPGVIRTDPANSWGYLSPQAELLPQALKRAGYATALVGKWHLGLEEPNLPNSRGFDRFDGFLGDMMDDYRTHRRHGINYMRRDREAIEPQGHATDLFTDWACEYLSARRRGQPFFLYLAYNAPHDPVQPPEEVLERVRRREPSLTEERARLVALIEHMDTGIGRVLDALDGAGRRDDTLVIFTSDNGGRLATGANNGANRAGKATLYEGGLRVPFLARWPGRIRAGSRSRTLAATMDIAPTVLDAAGVPSPRGIDGLSLMAVLQGRRDALPPRDLFFTMREGGNLRGGTMDAVRRGDWKLLRSRPDAAWELYDLAHDPQEANDLANARPAKAAELRNALDAHLARCASVPWKNDRTTTPGE